MQWTIDLEHEIASDLSVFHRIDDPSSLDAPRYFRLAELLPFYDGAVRHRFQLALIEEARKEQPRPAPAGADAKVMISKADHEPRPNAPGIEYRGR